MSNNTKKFDTTAKGLHWISAIIILWATISGFYIGTLSPDSTVKHLIGELNVSAATVFIPIFIWRIFHRLSVGTPGYSFLQKNEETLALGIHLLIYITVTVVLISGVLMMKEDYSVFRLITLPSLISNEPLLEWFAALHTYASMFLAGCIVLHLLAIVKHEIKGIRLLRRML
jgi:cytochrome b561